MSFLSSTEDSIRPSLKLGQESSQAEVPSSAAACLLESSLSTRVHF